MLIHEKGISLCLLNSMECPLKISGFRRGFKTEKTVLPKRCKGISG
jgi:hypothetical protein